MNTNKNPLDFNAMSLEEIRAFLSNTDKELLRSLEMRLDAAKRICSLKKENNLPIQDLQQEEKKLHAIENIVNPNYITIAKSFMQEIMNFSREEQYKAHLADKETIWETGEKIHRAAKVFPNYKIGAYQGNEVSYTAQAARKVFPNTQWVPLTSFEQVCRQVTEEAVEIGVLPLENSSAGTIDSVYSLISKYQLYIIGETSIPIRHCLCALEGAELGKIKKVISHPQGLAQCSMMITGMGWEEEQSENTAYAAEHILKMNDPTIAALSSEEAAKKNGLSILMKDITNDPLNQTRFIVISKNPVITEKANKFSLILRTAHTTGSLAQVLMMFADRNMNLVKIKSLPTPQKPWEYSFHIDALLEKGSDRLNDLLYQLEKELPYVRFLGWYQESL